MSDPTDPMGSGQPPPQYGAPPPYQQPYRAVSANPAQTMLLIATIVTVAGYVTAGAGLVAALAFLTVDGVDGAVKLQQFMLSLATGLGLGAIAVGVGTLLRQRLQGPPSS